MKIANPVAVLGEQAAVDYLKKKKYSIIDRNFRQGYGEIDIIALFDQTLVFIEVKTRSSGQFGNIRESITPWKLKTLTKTCEYYKLIHRSLPDRLRIDAIFVVVSQNNQIDSIEHVENITGF